MNDERLHILEGIPETKRKIKEKKKTITKAAVEGEKQAAKEGRRYSPSVRLNHFLSNCRI